MVFHWVHQESSPSVLFENLLEMVEVIFSAARVDNFIIRISSGVVLVFPEYDVLESLESSRGFIQTKEEDPVVPATLLCAEGSVLFGLCQEGHLPGPLGQIQFGDKARFFQPLDKVIHTGQRVCVEP